MITLSLKELDAILISSVSNILYLTNYSGFSKEEREAYLLIVRQPQQIVRQPQGLTHKTPGVLGYIFTDGRYSQAVRNKIKNFKLIEITPELTFEKILKSLAKKHRIKRLGIEENNLTIKEHKTISKYFNYINHYSIYNQRVIKNQKEINEIEEACRLGDKTFDHILKKIKLGISEKELANEIEFFIKRNNADISFKPIVAFGKNSAIPHHVPTNNKLTNNQIVLLDLGAKVNNYCSDMTRTVFFGSASAEYKKMYQTVLNAQKLAIDYLSRCHSERSEESRSFANAQDDNGIKANKADKIARDYIISKGYPTIPHSLGHGIGIDVHEHPHLSPKSKDILKPGMVFSIEPGIYLPNFGGVRIEDLVVLENSGWPDHKTRFRLLTKSTKKMTQI